LSAFASSRKRSSWTDGKPLTYLEDENGNNDLPPGTSVRERSPSVDSIFRRPSNNEPSGFSSNANTAAMNVSNAQRRSIHAVMNSTEGATVTVDRRSSNAAMMMNSSTLNNTSSNCKGYNETVRRTSWADKFKNTFGQDTNSNNRAADENTKQGRRRSSTNGKRKSKRGSGRGSWRDMFGKGVEKPRPAPLIDDPDPDEDDGGEYFLAKRGKRNSNTTSSEKSNDDNVNVNVMHVGYDETMVQRMQQVNMIQHDPAVVEPIKMTESAHSSTNYYKQSKGFKDWDSVAVESDARRHLGASNMLDSSRFDVKNSDIRSNSHKQKRGIRQFFSKKSKQESIDDLPHSERTKSKGSKVSFLSKLSRNKESSQAQAANLNWNSPAVEFPVRKHISRSTSYEDNDGAYRVVM